MFAAAGKTLPDLALGHFVVMQLRIALAQLNSLWSFAHEPWPVAVVVAAATSARYNRTPPHYRRVLRQEKTAGNDWIAAWDAVVLDGAASVVIPLATLKHMSRFAVDAAGKHFHWRKHGSKWDSDTGTQDSPSKR